jgi:hypothetical protein
MSAIVASLKASKEKISLTSLRVNPKLPAPINANFAMANTPYVKSIPEKKANNKALRPGRALLYVPAQYREPVA